jgi:hypothetical protein
LLVTSAAAVLLLLALLAAGVVVARRRSSPGAEPVLTVRLRQPLGKESGVAVVRWGQEELLVGYGTAGVVRLAGGIAPEGRA